MALQGGSASEVRHPPTPLMAGAARLALLAAVASLASLASLAVAGPNPPNLLELECKVKRAAYAWAGAKQLPQPGIATGLARALSTPRCSIEPAAASLASVVVGWRVQPKLTIFVARTGSDKAGDGSSAQPFATLRRAQAAIHAARATTSAEPAELTAMVCVAAGTYTMARALSLSPEDSHTIWSGMCDGAAAGAVVLTGAESVTPSNWRPSGDPTLPGVFVADLKRFAAFNQLLADGRRQIRARFPNGDPEGVSGLCFTKGQCRDDQSKCTQDKGQWPEAGEGCAGYTLGDATGETSKGPDQQYSEQIIVDGPVRAQ